MQKILILLFVGVNALPLVAQKKPVAEVTKIVRTSEAQAHLAFLSADEMRGRDTGSPELDIAANYIAAHFSQLGLQPAPGQSNYFQTVQLESSSPATDGTLQLDTASFKLKQNLLVMKGDDISWQGDFIFAGYGSKEEMTDAVKGKVVVTLAGAREMSSPMQIFSLATEKSVRAQQLGAKGLVELLVSLPFPWPGLVNYLGNNTRTEIKKDATIPVVWVKSSENGVLQTLKKQSVVKGSLVISGIKKKSIPAKNVVAVLTGSDPKLKDEYVVISAHYDHVGIGRKVNQDSIYNGARDNAIGTVGMMETARFLSAFPPKRSVVFIALTAEEKGMLGSQWYAEHPLIPLNKTVFNFNCDGAGYNDKNIVTVNGLEKTTAETYLATACSAFGLKATLDPVPEQNLYERSDNISFARKGVPAINFAPGIKAFDKELMQYYHQPADEFGSLDMEYLSRYFRAYAYANYLIANADKTPYWKAGEKYEVAAGELYKK